MYKLILLMASLCCTGTYANNAEDLAQVLTERRESLKKTLAEIKKKLAESRQNQQSNISHSFASERQANDANKEKALTQEVASLVQSTDKKTVVNGWKSFYEKNKAVIIGAGLAVGVIGLIGISIGSKFGIQALLQKLKELKLRNYYVE